MACFIFMKAIFQNIGVRFLFVEALGGIELEETFLFIMTMFRITRAQFLIMGAIMETKFSK